MKYNFLDADDQHDISKKPVLNETSVDDDQAVENPYFESEDSQAEVQEEANSYTETDNYTSASSEVSKSKLIPILIGILVLGVAYTLFYFLSQPSSTEPVAPAPIAKKDSIIIKPIPEQTLLLAGERTSRLNQASAILNASFSSTELGQIVFSNNDASIELLSTNRDGAAKLATQLRKIFDTVTVDNSKKRNSPTGGLIFQYNAKSNTSSKANFNKGQTASEIDSQLRALASNVKLTKFDLSQETAGAIQSIRVEAHGSRKKIAEYLNQINSNLTNLGLIRLIIAPTDQKTYNNSSMRLKARFQLLANE